MFFITDDLRVMLGFPGDLVQILLNCGIKNVSRIAEQFSFIEPNVKESTQKGGTIRVKMMQRKSEGKIVVAEASENFIDVLFSFLTIPLDSVLELVLAAEDVHMCFQISVLGILLNFTTVTPSTRGIRSLNQVLSTNGWTRSLKSRAHQTVGAMLRKTLLWSQMI
ncbi:hypothetical protein V6N13_027287 [Hibiscus sabdariffa]|uniref:Uncharacterized protein n=2 Tax=Hibiscus sabdariffa TaxID=183260 RepID=A0ABR2B609_9ROSI